MMSTYLMVVIGVTSLLVFTGNRLPVHYRDLHTIHTWLDLEFLQVLTVVRCGLDIFWSSLYITHDINLISNI